MSDLLEIFSILLQFFSFVLLATVLICVSMTLVFWSAELYDRARRRRGRRGTIPLTKIARLNGQTGISF
jgi:hypothetical protein